jgi:hypothetical protein
VARPGNQDAGSTPRAAITVRINSEAEAAPIFLMTRALALNGALGDADARRDFLVGVAGDNQIHHLTLTPAQPRDPHRGSGSPRRAFCRVGMVLQGALDAGQQLVAPDRLFDKIRRPGSHRLDRHRHVAVAGDQDGRKDITGQPQAAPAARSR